MAWTPLLLLLLSHCTGSLSQPVLTQPTSLSASPGASARLSCTLSSGINVGSYSIFWYQQKPGSPPRYLLYYYSDSRFKPETCPSISSSLCSGLSTVHCVPGTKHENVKFFMRTQVRGEFPMKLACPSPGYLHFQFQCQES
uniref:Ig-like domain-containing protein n=1 Tax=Macaca mulatta TaxID=9544 RepID=A0A5F8ATH5_MACMU